MHVCKSVYLATGLVRMMHSSGWLLRVSVMLTGFVQPQPLIHGMGPDLSHVFTVIFSVCVASFPGLGTRLSVCGNMTLYRHYEVVSCMPNTFPAYLIQ